MKTPKFKIGDIVYIKDDINYYLESHNKKFDTYGNPRPRGLTITERMIEECEGGIQIHYKFMQLTNWVPEIALTNTFLDPMKKEEK